MWFSKKDISQYQLPKKLIKGLHGYVLPHAGTTYTGHILAHTLRFKPTKKFKNIIIFYLPSNPNPNVSGEYHEYYVPKEALKLYYPEENYNYYGFNVAPKIKNSNKLILKQIKERHITKSNTLFIISADFSHFLPLQEAIKKENCAAHSLMHLKSNLPCIKVVDDIRSFHKFYSLFPNLKNTIQLQWIGRTRSPGLKGVGYLSFLMRDKPKFNLYTPKPNLQKQHPDGLFVTAYDAEMRQRECLGNTTQWTPKIEKDLIADVLHKARTTSRLTGGMYLEIPVTYYSITYLFKDTSKDFIRGYHAILKGALYLPDVFLENTYDNGVWFSNNDTQWPKDNNFKLEPTFKMLQQKAGWKSQDYQLYSSQVLHKKVNEANSVNILTKKANNSTRNNKNTNRNKKTKKRQK